MIQEKNRRWGIATPLRPELQSIYRRGQRRSLDQSTKHSSISTFFKNWSLFPEFTCL